MSATYDTDFYAWANEQAALLRTGNAAAADLANIAEEIESIGRSERRELVNRLAILLTHLLKWRVQPGYRSASWNSTIREQRLRIRLHLADNPSLKACLDDAYARAYELAVIAAARETGLAEAVLPKAPPFGAGEAMDADFWPD
jgi:hypothetical protein